METAFAELEAQRIEAADDNLREVEDIVDETAEDEGGSGLHDIDALHFWQAKMRSYAHTKGESCQNKPGARFPDEADNLQHHSAPALSRRCL